MARLRDTRTGVVVDVDDPTATALGAAYEPADKPAPKPPAKKAPSSKSSK